MPLEAGLLEILACPACHAPLKEQDTELGAAAAYLTAGFTGPGRRERSAAAPPGPAGTDAKADRPVRSG